MKPEAQRIAIARKCEAMKDTPPLDPTKHPFVVLPQLQKQVHQLEQQNAGLRERVRELEALCDDAYGHIICHHNAKQMIPMICPVCVGEGEKTLDRLGEIRRKRNNERQDKAALARGEGATHERNQCHNAS